MTFVATMLFDIGITHTFISCKFVPKLGVMIEDLGFDLIVTTLTRSVVTTALWVKRIIVVIQQYTIFLDSILL